MKKTLIEHGLQSGGCQVHRLARKLRGQPSYMIRLKYPLQPHLWDRLKGLRGWVASERQVESVVIRDADGAAFPGRLEEQADVTFFLRYRFPFRTGFLCDRPVRDWLGGRDEARLTVEVSFMGGGRGEYEVVLTDDRKARQAKFARYRSCLRCPETGAALEDRDGALHAPGGRSYPVIDGVVDFLPDDFKKTFGVDLTENVSSWDYDQRIVDIITANPDKLFLDCGAGLRKVCYPNVINYEIVNYSTTDVLGVAEKLPFADHSLDGVISVAVLEHVKDPFLSAAEMSRVLKPGGVLFCAVPFLQPLHGYPHHYYNMTAEGMKNLFPKLAIEDVYVPLSLHPIQSIRWILYSYIRGLPESEWSAFENLRVKDIFRLPQFDSFYRKEIPFIHRLSPQAMTEVAAGHCLVARKPD